jgi:hypothetical protein
MIDEIATFIGRSLARLCFIVAYRARLWPIVPYFGIVSTIWGIAYLAGATADTTGRQTFVLSGAGAFLVLPMTLLVRRRQWFHVPSQPYPLPEVSVASVKPGAFHRFVGNGIRFSYPRKWKLEDESVKERFAVTVVSRGSALVMLTSVNPGGGDSLEAFVRWYAANLAGTIEDKGGTVTFGEMRATQAQMGPDLKLGLLQPFRVRLEGDDAPLVCECYRLPGGIYVLLQAMEVDWHVARTGFEMVLGSLEVAPDRTG